MKKLLPVLVGILVGLLVTRRFGRECVEVAVGLYLPLLLLFTGRGSQPQPT